MSSTGFINGSTLTDAGWFNDTDTLVYSRLTSVSGTNTVVGTGPVSMTAYAVGQLFTFIPANTNTTATTLNITPSGGSALGAKNIFYKGAALFGGEITANVPSLVYYDGTQFNLLNSGGLSSITASLGADVTLDNTGNYFDGPSVAQGTVGKWFVSGQVTLNDTAAANACNVKLWDGTTVINSALVNVTAANRRVVVSLSGVINSPAGNLRISVNDSATTTGVIVYNGSSNGKDSTITAIRI